MLSTSSRHMRSRNGALNFFTAWPLYYTFDQWRSQLFHGAVDFIFDRRRSRLINGAWDGFYIRPVALSVSARRNGNYIPMGQAVNSIMIIISSP